MEQDQFYNQLIQQELIEQEMAGQPYQSCLQGNDEGGSERHYPTFKQDTDDEESKDEVLNKTAIGSVTIDKSTLN